MYNRFLGQTFAGKSGTSERVVAVVITWSTYLLLGGFPLLVLMMVEMASKPDFLQRYMDKPFDIGGMDFAPFPFFVALMLSFVIGMAGLAFGVVKIQKRAFKTLITGFAKVRWMRLLAALGLWMALSGAGTFVSWLMHPGSIVLNPDAADLLWFALPALILIPIQSSFEELAIRGQMLQNMSRHFKMPLIPLIITSLFFALLHGMNTEIGQYGFVPMMTFYFSFGFFMGMVTLMDEGLEMAMGIHIGNNLFAFLFVTYPGASVETPSLFLSTGINSESDLGLFFASVVVMLMVFFGRRTRNYRALVVNEPITPYS